MYLLGLAIKDPPAFASGYSSLDVKGFMRTIGQGDLIGAEEQLEEFKKVKTPALQVEIRQAETLLKIQLFFQGIKKTPLDSWEEEEREFLAFLTNRVDLPCPEIEQAADRTLSYLQMKKKGFEVSRLVADLVAFSQGFVDVQTAGTLLSSEELKPIKETLGALKDRVEALNWNGKEGALNQIAKLEKAMPSLQKTKGISIKAGIFELPGIKCFIRFFTKLFASKPRAEAVSQPLKGPSPIGIPNEGATCFLASAVQIILKNPILEEALIQEWAEGGPAREFGEFLFNYREAQKAGQLTVSGIGKLRQALSRLSGNDEFLRGQWDANEVIRTLISDEKSPLFQRLQEKGYFLTESVRRYYEPPRGMTPIANGDLAYDPERGAYYSERASLRPPQIEVELSASDAGKSMNDLIGRVWAFSLEGSDSGNYQMQDGKKHPCKPLYQKTNWNTAAPNFLTVSLKRWAYAGAGVKVDVPVKAAEIEEIRIGQSKVSMKLAGFALHSGGTGGGHWVSYSAQNGSYTCNNDGRVYPVTRETFLSHAQKGSEFFYEKVPSS